MIFRGNDGGSIITALTLDMSEAGVATFNNAVVASGISQFADVNIPDNNAIRFGSSQDLQIYHDGSDSYIRDQAGTGDLIISTNAFRLKSANAGETMITAFEDGAVNLMHNDSTKLSTTSGGVTVTGVITTDGLTTSLILILVIMIKQYLVLVQIYRFIMMAVIVI